jgi:fibronectin type 3 domain-containing protein
MESDPTTPVCVTPVDTFPPAAPQNLDAVTSDGGVSLIWESVGDKDVAGYVVLRGDASSETLAPLNTEPIRETTFRDTTVQTGRSYVYAVVAVDTAVPSNRSQESNRVTQAVR